MDDGPRGLATWRRVARGASWALLLAAGASGLWRSFYAWSVATAAPVVALTPHERMLGRYAAARPAVAGVARAGYLSPRVAAASPGYHLARLALLPTVVTPAAEGAVVVADFDDEAALDEAVAAGGWRVVWRGGEGLAVLARGAR